MLVLTRKVGESIVLPGLDITIKVVSVTGGKVRLGIDAPVGFDILREELVCACPPPFAFRELQVVALM